MTTSNGHQEKLQSAGTAGTERQLNLGDVKARAVRGVKALLLRQGAIAVIGFGGMLVLVRLLTPEMFGVFAIAQFVILFFDQLSDMGLTAALLRKKDGVTEQELRTVFTIQQLVVTVAMVAILLLAPPIGDHYGLDAEQVWLIRAMAVALLLASLKTVPSVLIQRQLRHDRLSVVEVTEQAVYQGTAIAFALLGAGLWALAIAAITRGVAGVALLYAISGWRPAFGIRRDVLGQILRFGVPMQLAGLSTLANNSIAPVMVGSFFGPAAVGFVNFGKRMLDFLAFQPLILTGRVQLRVFGRVQDDERLLRAALERSLFVGSILVFYLLAMLVALASPFIEYVATEKWMPSLPLIYLLAIGYTAYAVLQPCLQLLKATGDAGTPLRVSLLKFAMEAAMFLALAPHLGLLAYGLGYATAVIACSLYAVRKVRQHTTAAIVSSVAPAFAAAVAGGAVAHLIAAQLDSPGGAALGLVTGSVVYALALGLSCGRRLSRELQELLGAAAAGRLVSSLQLRGAR